MILTCNSCNKKFVVPDSAITESGRMVQCGSCGNKWRQFSVNLKEKDFYFQKLYQSQLLPSRKQIIQSPKNHRGKL